MNENFPQSPKSLNEANRIIDHARKACAETHAVFNHLADLANLTVREKKICRKVLDNSMAVSLGLDKPYRNVLGRKRNVQ